jgi:uncharacterized cupredoxin-like copper-binding protein
MSDQQKRRKEKAMKARRLGKARLGAMIAVGCSVSLHLVGSALAAPLATHAAAKKWLSVNTGSQTATLTLISAYNSTNNGYNFDGYGNGKMVVTIPMGWHVKVKCSTDSSATVNHSCAVTKSLTATKPAFPHATVPNAMNGLAPGSSATFTFVPTKVGRYRINCLVPGHEAAGMWDTLMVVASGTPAISFK